MDTLLTSKMPSEAPVYPTQPEKPHHYTYLKEFRTQQCPLFLQHKCTQHRPYTCFHWHFLNQRRRRPIRKRDGTFSYSPDVYCTKYDETTGICPDGDDCPFLHRTAGDTERRYHLRYYKTGTCVHETDSKGHCVKNGPHCAFAHGAHDLRTPVYDIRELQAVDVVDKTGSVENTAAGQLEKDRMVNEDPRWNDTNYVLANYKTENCKRPPRLCRQGYACPSYHNSRDRRRSPKKFKYRSTPCPNVKHGDDWGDPTQCENGDSCPYCHTRTEQQFHPEIYKSTKCNDMVQTGYCPRGPFCAFAHVEQEMTTQREMGSASENSLAAFVTSVLPHSNNKALSEHNTNGISDGKDDMNDTQKEQHTTNGSIYFQGSLSTKENNTVNSSLNSVNLPEPIGKKRSGSVSSQTGHESPSRLYGKAPGSEREDAQVKLRHQMQVIEDNGTIDSAEKAKRKQNLLLLHNLNVVPGTVGALVTGVDTRSTPTTPSSTVSSTMSPHAPSFYPAGDTVESVIGNALDEDLSLGELSHTLSAIERDAENDNNSLSGSYGQNFPSASSYFGPPSLPVQIPASSSIQRNSLGSLSQSPTSSPLSSFVSSSFMPVLQQQQKQEIQLQEAATAFLSQPNPGKFSAPGYSDYNSMSPRSNSVSQSPLLGSSAAYGMNGYGEVQRLRTELATNKAQIAQWEEGIAQARNACDAWRKEAEEATRKAKIAEEERAQAYKQRDEALNQLAKLKVEVDQLRGGPFLHCIQRGNELDKLPLSVLKQLENQLRLDLDTLQKITFQHTAVKCMVCQERNRNVVVLPCNHYVLCDQCANKRADCPFCHSQIGQRTNMVISM